jgi:hypothetical protein
MINSHFKGHIFLLPLLLFFPTTPSHAQIVTGWGNEDTRLPGQKGTAVVSSLSAWKDTSSTKSDVFQDWKDLLGEFGQEIKKSETINKEIQKASISTKKETRSFVFGNKTFELPTIINEEGIDLYMLTNEGINIYMAMLSPSYYYEPDEDLVRWVRFYAFSHRKMTERMFGRFSSWETHIKDVFTSYGVPSELSVICLVESSCTYGAVSPVGASGMWQIMPETGRTFGLTVNYYKDERMDPTLATFAAGRILRDYASRTGDWTLATAAYNCGPGKITTLAKKLGTKDWKRIRDYLPKETKEYVPAVLALDYIWTYRDRLGFTR